VPKKKPSKRAKTREKQKMHRMPDGHMMSDAEMKKQKKRMGSRY